MRLQKQCDGNSQFESVVARNARVPFHVKDRNERALDATALAAIFESSEVQCPSSLVQLVLVRSEVLLDALLDRRSA